MNKTFNSQEYIQDLGKELIEDFIKAGKSTHPGSVGSGREKAIKRKLKNILPHGVGVGSGFVIDSYGNTSAQCDLIIYEENYALKFVINEDEDWAFYNCECVIAVGEVKSDATITEIEDSFIKFKKIRSLLRYHANDNTYRCYLSNMVLEGIDAEKYDPSTNELDQIFTFLLCKNLKTSLNTIVERAKTIFDTKSEYFNFILPIEGNAISFINTERSSVTMSAMTGNAIVEILENDFHFNIFLGRLTTQIQNGRSVRLINQKYIQNIQEFHMKNIVVL